MNETQIICINYSTRSDIILNMCIHVEYMNNNNLIHNVTRNKYIQQLNDGLNILNINYDNVMLAYKKNCTEIIDTDVKKHFLQTDIIILDLMKKIGSLSINDLFYLKVGPRYREILGIDNDVNELRQYTTDIKKNTDIIKFMSKMHNSSALLDIICKVFVPVEMEVCTKKFNNKKTSILINKFKYDKISNSEESVNFKYEIMLENSYKITIKCAKTNTCFIVHGYFSYDTINTILLTACISNNFIHHKKNLLIEYVNTHSSINKEFKDTYCANLSLGDILSMKGCILVDEMTEDYETYTKINTIKFKTTISDYLKADLKKKYNILKCLLLGQKNSIKNAAMLFGLTKHQNRENGQHKSFIADILFKNLPYLLQLKLRKSGQYLKQDIENIKNISISDMDLKQQCILNNSMCNYIKKCTLTRIDDLKTNNSDYHKNLTYIKTLINYPWIKKEYTDLFTCIGGDIIKSRNKLNDIKNEFNKKVFGQDEFKTVICDVVGKWLSNPNSIGKAIGLCGPPGCGKTLIASSLGKVLNIPYQEIHVGGLDDGSVLNGHSFTYSGAQPGLIVTKMIMAGEPRCILFFDELDKACIKHGINEISNVLIHATDPNTNSKFSDKFFQDVYFPLNKCIFVFSFNDISKIDPVLKDRMEIINVSSYSIIDKIQITHNYLVPELLDGICIERGSILFTDSVIEYIIKKYTLESGVRSLKNNIEKIFLKLNIDRIYEKGVFKNKKSFSKDTPITITKKNIIKYLGKSKMNIEKIHSDHQIGVVNGLYASDNGSGGIVPILCYPAKNGLNRFTLEMTGKQGQVMQESVNFAWTIAKNCVKPHIVDEFYTNNISGIHVHTPDGAVSKDGPSAGCAFTTAFISRITGFAVKKYIAMTGEISIGGTITAIGGLIHKLTGAKVAGVRLVFVSGQNIDDIKFIKDTDPDLFKLVESKNKKVKALLTHIKDKKIKNDSEFKVIIVNTIYDIIPYALIDPVFITEKYATGKYNTCDETCNIKTFMLKHHTGFNNKATYTSRDMDTDTNADTDTDTDIESDVEIDVESCDNIDI